MKNSTQNSAGGFALIATLAILTIVAILVVAYASTARTERAAAQNFSERERAQAIAQGMLSRILADHAAPLMSGSSGGRKVLPPYQVDADTKLPTKDTNTYYNAEIPVPGIYRMEPFPDLDTANNLARISRPTDPNTVSTPAYTPSDWMWARKPTAKTSDPAGNLGDYEIFLPKNVKGEEIAPSWVDYLDVDSSGKTGDDNALPIGEVAFCVWDESGKFDINLAGPDTDKVAINGLAPHDLGFEKLADKPEDLLAFLNGGNELRDRSNFGLRKIRKNTDPLNNTGDDRWAFSIEELLSRGLLTPAKAIQATTSSRDFDVRPEWDGKRAATEARKFSRSFINNPQLFKALAEPSISGFRLVTSTLDEKKLRQTLKDYGPANIENIDDWMQVMRLLAALRLSLPPFANLASPTVPPVGTPYPPLPRDNWYDDDVWGIALNIMQASAPVADQNLFAFDRKTYTVFPFNDPNVRIGIRVCPMINEAAVKVKRTGDQALEVTEYFELWNPYDVDLSGETYYFGSWSGHEYPAESNGQPGSIYSMNTRFSTTGPGPGKFKVVQILRGFSGAEQAKGKDFKMRTRPYIQHKNYWEQLIAGGGSVEESSSYSVSIGPFFTGGGARDPAYNLTYFIPNSIIANNNDVGWASFQIDDPRMGSYTRYSKQHTTTFIGAQNDTDMYYSWRWYPNIHSLFGIGTEGSASGGKYSSPYGDGFNQNFGENWPPGYDKNKAMATFALPRRPLYNIGELGTVFAERPWTSLSFANTISPLDSRVPAGPSKQNYPTVLLDYLTTVGTSVDYSTPDPHLLPYKAPAAVPTEQVIQANFDLRKQNERWLYESVDKKGVGSGNLRPIRGKINLNSANWQTLKTLLSAPYRMPRSFGLDTLSPTPVDKTPDSDLYVSIKAADAEKVAKEIVGILPSASGVSIRPFRSLVDLRKLTTIAQLHKDYPDSLADAVVGRLGQFGTVRQQSYTVDIIARALNQNMERRRAQTKNGNLPRVVTAEVRLRARVYFDTFSRKSYIESMEYR